MLKRRGLYQVCTQERRNPGGSPGILPVTEGPLDVPK